MSKYIMYESIGFIISSMMKDILNEPVLQHKINTSDLVIICLRLVLKRLKCTYCVDNAYYLFDYFL